MNGRCDQHKHNNKHVIVRPRVDDSIPRVLRTYTTSDNIEPSRSFYAPGWPTTLKGWPTLPATLRPAKEQPHNATTPTH